MADAGERDVRDRLAEALFLRAFAEGNLDWNRDLDDEGRRWWKNDAALFMASTLPAVGLRIGRVEE